MMISLIKNILFLVIGALIITACSKKNVELKVDNDDIRLFSTMADDNFINQEEAKKNLISKFFQPWETSSLANTKKDAMWGFMYKNKKVYLENHILADKKWFDKQIKNSNFDKYGSLLKKAIAIRNTNVRVLPTYSPMFYKPSVPGEGFPFDYNQNSSIKINTPLIVSHLSKDKAWAYVDSYIVSGWVNIKDIAYVDYTFIKKFKNSNYYVSVKEKFPIYNPEFVDYIKLGTIFPSKNNKIIVAKKGNHSKAVITFAEYNPKEIRPLGVKFNKENRIRILKELLEEPYSWGGILNNRDCSSFTQDFFIPFGLHLNRNSKAQISNGKYYDISNLSLEEKKNYIRSVGVPFSTLVYLRGHIMLYIGSKDGEPMVAHNFWSVKLKDSNNNEFRHIVGKTVITTLEPGKNLKGFDKDNNVLKKVMGIVVL